MCLTPYQRKNLCDSNKICLIESNHEKLCIGIKYILFESNKFCLKHICKYLFDPTPRKIFI